MASFGRKKDEYTCKDENLMDCSNYGTAARTRPISFDEIILRRKTKKELENSEGLPGIAGAISGKSMVQRSSNRVDSDRNRREEFAGRLVKHSSDGLVTVNSRKKDNVESLREGKLLKAKDEESHHVQRKLKSIIYKNDNSGDRSEGAKKDERTQGKRNDDWSSDDSQKDIGNRRFKDSVLMYRYRNRAKSNLVSKRKNQSENDERNRDRDVVKKQDSRKRQDSKFLEKEKNKGSSDFWHEDSRSKRRRSRSREPNKDRHKRSFSPSPRGHKRTSYDALSAHSSKDRSGRFNSENDRKRVSNNGSSKVSSRHGVSSVRLGGYSPRKRRSEAAVKTPSPVTRSPEKKSAGWDLPPAGTENNFFVSTLADVKPVKKNVLPKSSDMTTLVSVTSSTTKPNFGAASGTPSKINASIDSIQLTQATRPRRRLYVDNLPASASEETLLEGLNNFLLSTGANHIPGTQPCISCIIHKEKGQAVVEFLTPEDASAALSFNGRFFSGSILKVKRPKDFVEVATGVLEKPVASISFIKDVVEDSPHKIFVGSISTVISSVMLMDIASTFGPLKAYRFNSNVDLGEASAFLEYVDQSVTAKACAGLNGMKLGGQPLTVIQAIPDTYAVADYGRPPSYGIPEYARPLLEKPTEVLKLKNVLDPSSLPSLSEQEIEEIVEDVRIECARFGTIKSINIVKHAKKAACINDGELNDKNREVQGMGLDLVKVDRSESLRSYPELGRFEEQIRPNENQVDKPNRKESAADPKHVNDAAESSATSTDEVACNVAKDEACDSGNVDSVQDRTLQDYNPATISQESANQHGSMSDQLNSEETKHSGDFETENESLIEIVIIKPMEENENLEKIFLEAEFSARNELETTEKDEKDEEEGPSNLVQAFETGCILVEYKRVEASSMAARCLHARLFDGRVVEVGYVARDVYSKRFPK